MMIFTMSEEKLTKVNEYLSTLDLNESIHANLKLGLAPLSFVTEECKTRLKEITAHGIYYAAFNKNNIKMSRKSEVVIYCTCVHCLIHVRDNIIIAFYFSRTVYYAKVFKSDVPKAVEILADILQNSRLDEGTDCFKYYLMLFRG